MCRLEMINKPRSRVRVIPAEYEVMRCTETKKEYEHTKMVENCQNVTRQNCITEWGRNRNGTLVWTGNQECEPVTWRECSLVPQTQSFTVPQVWSDSVRSSRLTTDCPRSTVLPGELSPSPALKVRSRTPW